MRSEQVANWADDEQRQRDARPNSDSASQLCSSLAKTWLLASDMASLAPRLPRAVMSLADLETSQLQRLIVNAAAIKRQSNSGREALNNRSHVSHNFLKHKSIALLFNKRSTRTRIAAEVAINRLGGHAMFLSDSDIQLGVNESLKDTALVLSQLTSGIFARVGDHSEIEVSVVHVLRDPPP